MPLVHRARWVLPVEGAPIPGGEVVVQHGVILEVRPGTAAPQAVEHDGVLMPGLVNAHTHLVYGPAFADLANSGLPFDEWITHLLPRRRAMSPAELTDQARASATLAVAAGTTSVADVASHVDTIAVLAEAGLGGRAYYELAGADDAVWGARREVWERELAAHPQAGISPHTLYTLGDGVVRELALLARSQGRRLHPHLAETTSEAEFVLTGTGPYVDFGHRFGLAFELAGVGSGRTPVGHLDALGGLGPDVHVAHGVHTDATDRRTLRQRGCAVALCVRSNAVLGAGEAPVADYRAEHSPVAIGTDSLASCPDLDVLAELRAVRALATAQGSPTAGLDRWLVEAATVGGARAVGVEAGVLRPGARADLVVVQGSRSDDPYAEVVSGHAVATYLGGVRA